MRTFSKPIFFQLFFQFLIIFNIYADEILLTNGQMATTEILDTNGCEVKILRNGNIVSIKKNLIEIIIWKLDTISFTGYLCEEEKMPIVKYEDSPEYQLILLLDNTREVRQKFQENSKIAFLSIPLKGNYNTDEFTSVQTPLIELLKKKGKTEILSPSEMLKTVKADEGNFNYAFFAKEYHVFKNNNTQKNYDSYLKFKGIPTPSFGKTISKPITVANFVLYDISKGTIVYNISLRKKGTIYVGLYDLYTDEQKNL